MNNVKLRSVDYKLLRMLSAFLLSFAQYALVIIDRNACAQQISGNGASLPVGTLDYKYDARYKDADFEVSVQPPEKISRSHSGVIIVQRTGEPPASFPLPDDLGMVKSITRVSKTKFLIIQGSTAPYSGVLVFDAGTQNFVEDFPCYNPVLSPDHRFLSFLRMFPAHFVEEPAETSSYEMLYDFSKDKDHNRTGTATPLGRIDYDPGVLVDPRRFELKSWQRDPKLRITHSIINVFFSPDSTKLFFLDELYPSDRVQDAQAKGNLVQSADIPLHAAVDYVLIDLTAGHPIVRKLPASLCAEPSGEECGLRARKVEFEPLERDDIRLSHSLSLSGNWRIPSACMC